MKKSLIIAACCLVAGLALSCKNAAYVDLGKKAVEVDSLIIKARAAGKVNMDSLHAARKAMAMLYIAGIDPDKVKAADYSAAARLFFWAGKMDSARSVLERHVQALSDKDGLELLFNIYLKKGELAKAEELLDSRLKSVAGDDAGECYINLLYAYQEQGEFDKAIAVADAAVAALPKGAGNDMALEKADMLNQLGEKSAALDLLQRLKSEFKEDARLGRAITAKTALFNMVGKPGSEWKAASWIDSQPVTLKSLRGKVVFLDFWAPWCGPCRAMFPHIKLLYAQYHEKGLEVIGITRYYGRFNQLGQNLRNISSTEELAWIKKFKEFHQIPFAYAVAEGAAAAANDLAYGVYGIPHMVLIDKKGNVRYYAIGSGPASEEKLSKGVAELIAE